MRISDWSSDVFSSDLAIQAHAGLYTGLVECGVGLVPGWGGNGEMIDRARKAPGMPKGPMPAVAKVFETVSTATVSKSAAEAKEQIGSAACRERVCQYV